MPVELAAAPLTVELLDTDWNEVTSPGRDWETVLVTVATGGDEDEEDDDEAVDVEVLEEVDASVDVEVLVGVVEVVGATELEEGVVEVVVGSSGSADEEVGGGEAVVAGEEVVGAALEVATGQQKLVQKWEQMPTHEGRRWEREPGK